MYRNNLKRIFDIVLSTMILLVSTPIILFVVVLLYFNNKGKVFFLQNRPGREQKIFRIIKFKTMNDLKDKHGNLLPDKDRMTRAGSIIRKLSIDELPQLLNVLNGDMSIVGPRPLLPQYLPLYNQTQQKRHNVLPGITGLAQVKGRNDLSWDQKLSYDVYYVEHVNFCLDMKILLQTFQKVLMSTGVSAKGHATTTAFKGK